MLKDEILRAASRDKAPLCQALGAAIRATRQGQEVKAYDVARSWSAWTPGQCDDAADLLRAALEEAQTGAHCGLSVNEVKECTNCQALRESPSHRRETFISLANPDGSPPRGGVQLVEALRADTAPALVDLECKCAQPRKVNMGTTAAPKESLQPGLAPHQCSTRVVVGDAIIVLAKRATTEAVQRTSVHYPLSFGADELDPSDSRTATLRAMCLHTGSAHSGHYFAVVRDQSDSW